MSFIKEKILADAQTLKPQYADRMEAFEPQLDDLPAGLTHYAIQIAGLYDYIPINYIVIGYDYYTSLRAGDFAKLMQHLQLINSDRLSATDVAILYLLIDFSSRDLRLVEKATDIELPDTAPDDLKLRFAAIVSPPNLIKGNGRVDLTFYCFNFRTGCLERFKLTIYASYHYDADNSEVLNLMGR